MGYSGRIVGVTGNVLQVDVDEFLSQGADSVLSKPFVMERFIEVLRAGACDEET
jgi:CheY-like chemotaxis protein